MTICAALHRQRVLTGPELAVALERRAVVVVQLADPAADRLPPLRPTQRVLPGRGRRGLLGSSPSHDPAAREALVDPGIELSWSSGLGVLAAE
jgi:hypothetical protein